MSDHNFSGRLWATAALIAAPFAVRTGLGWWLPLHMALLGAVTQAIVGGQLMFSATLGLSRGPSRSVTLGQLGLLNAAAILVITGRLVGEAGFLIAGVSLFVPVIAWVTWQIHTMWRASVNRRFSLTGTFYRLAAVSLLFGASIGGALAVGGFNEPSSYIAHRGVHSILNVYGWAGMTIVGTAITLVPTVLHVRVSSLKVMRRVPWLMVGGLLVMSTGATTRQEWLAGSGMGIYLCGLAAFGLYLRNVLATPRRRRIPTAALHLVAAMAWAGISTTALIIAMMQGDDGATRDLVVVGGAVGFAFQALLGAWSFLLPSTRAPVPQRRRVELMAMELGGLAQVVAFNLGVLLTVVGLRSGVDASSIAGVTLAWLAAFWVLAKAWFFPALSNLPIVERLSANWWSEPDKERAVTPS